MNVSGLSSNSNAYAGYYALAPAARFDTPSPAGDAGTVVQDGTDSAEATPAVQAKPPAPPTDPGAKTKNDAKLSDEQIAEVLQLQARDRQVRQHEQAHIAASHGLATSGPSYTYETGPDGVSYAIGGEVSINTSPGKTPEETIARARTIQAAALAPADPSGADRAIAMQAQQMEQQARSELLQEKMSEIQGDLQAAQQALQPEQQDHVSRTVNKTYATTDHASGKSNKIDVYA